jgi:dipeptidyl aminopeptidase/acylaminoacyl peptidase
MNASMSRAGIRVCLLWLPLTSYCQEADTTKHVIQPLDCVKMRTIPALSSSGRPIAINKDGSRIAYLVKTPNLTTNENDIELHLKEYPDASGSSGKLLLKGDLSEIQWLGDGVNLMLLAHETGASLIERIDTNTGKATVLTQANGNITEYSTDLMGGTIAFATGSHEKDKEPEFAEDSARGYRVPFYETRKELLWSKDLYIAENCRSKCSPPKAVIIHSPFNGIPLSHLQNTRLFLSLSPDGQELLFQYVDPADKLPDLWEQSLHTKILRGVSFPGTQVLAMYDVARKSTSLALDFPASYTMPSWSPDGKSFALIGFPPVSSQWEADDGRKYGSVASSIEDLFWVDLKTRMVEEIAPYSALRNTRSTPVAWTNRGILVPTSINTLSWFSQKHSVWEQGETIRVPVSRIGLGTVASNGRIVLGTLEDVTTPPELFIYDVGAAKVQSILPLNPQFRNLTIAQTKEVSWRTSTGFNAKGLLLLPPGYVEGKRYPLVIQTKPFGYDFACEIGNFPSFAPQPLANAGIMYLGQYSADASGQHEADYFPKNYPGLQGYGGLSEAAFEMDKWDSAVQELDAQGMIDRTRVGIIGFSRSGWYTEFILAHSPIPYRAATVADNVEYGLGEYWIYHRKEVITGFDAMYGGPPYGASLKNWLDYSVSFNVDKIHTPILMEVMGYGTPYNNEAKRSIPSPLAGAFDVFTGLNILGRPVELYYYPNEDHQPQNPQARLATMERNVDWYRFWLEGEDPIYPADSERIGRWREWEQRQNLQERTASGR